jgi:hypothetical protein
MDIVRNKITRRVALGSIAGGLAGAAAVVQTLKGRYRVNMPSSSPRPSAGLSTVTGNGTVTVNGYTLNVPTVTMKIEKAKDWDTYRALYKEAVQKAMDNDPGYAAHLKELAARNQNTLPESLTEGANGA